ncbi:VOC family protein [Streptomyces malaysiensis]|uniref:VOC family protein n=1 Tax=Streptomyces malaysiensis TaxID=92644 RepID=UPI0034040C35
MTAASSCSTWSQAISQAVRRVGNSSVHRIERDARAHRPSASLPRRHRRERPRPRRHRLRETLRAGSSEIELIQPLDSRSPYTEHLDLHGAGVHHLAYVVESIGQCLGSLRATGEAAPATFEASVAGLTRFVYLDGLAHGPAIELIEMVGEDA